VGPSFSSLSGSLVGFPEREKQGSSHATSGFCHGSANHRLSARCGIARAQKVFPAGPPRGETHASNGWPCTATQGLRAAWIAQRNGFTPIRNIILRSGLCTVEGSFLRLAPAASPLSPSLPGSLELYLRISSAFLCLSIYRLASPTPYRYSTPVNPAPPPRARNVPKSFSTPPTAIQSTVYSPSGRAVRVYVTPSVANLPSPPIHGRSFGRFDEITDLVEEASALTLARRRRARRASPTATLQLLPRCGPAGPSMVRRSIGSTRFCISSKTHPISPSRILGKDFFQSVATSCRKSTHELDSAGIVYP
jgi:hypothetical protein